MGIIMHSKEEKVIKLFFENPTREWHFEEIVRTTRLARSKVDTWLKKFMKRGIIQRVKKRGKMPYYISNYSSSEYKNQKRFFTLKKLHESGLLNHLDSLPKAKTIIIFGSFSRSDWYQESDIDIFIYGNPEGLAITKYELKLHREIELFICQNKQELARLSNGLLRNIIKGNVIKGSLDFIEVGVDA